jgi:hypothetical protein
MTEGQQMADKIQLRRDTAANWTSNNPTLSQGEQGFETDTSKMKIGDGSTAWTGLDYFADTASGGGSGGGSFEAVASGTLADGSTLVLNTDGTVSVVGMDEGEVGGAGTASVFESARIQYNSITFDSNSNKVVIFYEDYENSNYGTAVVGTVTGKSISFGSPVVFASSFVETLKATFDSNSNKVVIAYIDRTNESYRGTAVVGTVSGTSISFGSPVVFNYGSTSNTSTTFDSNSNKVVIAYRNNSNSQSGTAIVGTVSGTSISFGTPEVFNSGQTNDIGITFDSNSNKVVIAYGNQSNEGRGTVKVAVVTGITIGFGSATVFDSIRTTGHSATFDSNSNKVVIAYQDYSNSYRGKAVVGTVSGFNDISFGSSVVFNSGASYSISATFDSVTSKVLLAYMDNGNSNYGTAIVGTVSGTSISFGSPDVFNSASSVNISTTFDSVANKVVIAYADYGNSGYGTAVVYQSVNFSASNLTADNYIGISNGAYADAATATVQIVGSVDDAQTGLTVGQKYYVQKDGSLATTADDPSVFAGTAVSATKLIIKG